MRLVTDPTNRPAPTTDGIWCHADQLSRGVAPTGTIQMLDDRHGFGFQNFAVKQIGAFALTEFFPVRPTAKITDPIHVVDFANHQGIRPSLAVGLAFDVKAAQIFQGWSWVHDSPPLLGRLKKGTRPVLVQGIWDNLRLRPTKKPKNKKRR